MQNSYAHLLSSAAAIKAKEVDGDKNAKALEDEKPPVEDEEEDKKAKKAKKAEKEEGDEAESEETEEDEDDEKKVKKAKKASASAVRIEERARCAAIFQSKAAAGRPQVAAQFAFHTDLSADSAIAIMGTLPVEAQEAPKATKPSLDQRMATVQNPNVGADVVQTNAPQAGSVSEEQMSKMSAGEKALMIVNAGRMMRGEAPLTKLPN